MRDLVPIKVRIVLGPDGSHQFPPFNQVPPEARGHLDWSKFLDAYGLGWHYDRVSGFGESDAGNADVPAGHEHRNEDHGCWYGATCVPKAFADEAVTRWPGEVSKLTEEAWASFYDDRAHASEPEEILDTEVLQGILARVQLEEAPSSSSPTKTPSTAIKAARAKCLDPDCQTHPGIRKNLGRLWADHKARLGCTIHPDHAS